MPHTLSCHNRESCEEWHDLRLDGVPYGTVFKEALHEFALVALPDGRRLWFGRRAKRGPLDLVVDPTPDAAPTSPEIPDDASRWSERDPDVLAAAPLLGQARKTAWLRQHWDVSYRGPKDAGTGADAVTWTVRPAKGIGARALQGRTTDDSVVIVAPLTTGKLKLFLAGWTVESVERDLEADALLLLGLLYHKILDDRRAPGLV